MEAASFYGVPTLWDGIKDTADSPTRSFYEGARPNTTTFLSIL